MIQIEIDGKEVSVEKGTSVIEAAIQAGTFIPHFCYHKKLSIAANCRMCLVEVEKVPKPLPACATLVAEGMKVRTNSILAKSAQKGVMEFLLLNHPLDCPICDQGGECQLQDLAVGYGQSHSRFEEAKNVVPPKDMGPLVAAIEMSRCIHCTRCIRFTEEVAGYQEIGMINRGEHSEIVPFIGKIVNSEISGNVIDLCPVGALTSKPFRYDSRTWELSRRKSISAHDSLGSNLEVQVKDKIVRRVLPRENEAINECWLSDRDRFAYEGLTHDERVFYPMIKQDNRWFTVDWETALRYVEKGLLGVVQEHGRDAIGIWANSNNTLEELYLLKKLAKSFGVDNIDTHLRVTDRRLNKIKKGALWLGQSINELLSSDVIVVIGAYLRQDQPLLTARIRQTVNKGAKLFVLQACKEELHIPKAVQKILSPYDWLEFLQVLTSGQYEEEYADLFKSAGKISIVLGEEAQLHQDFASLYQAAQQLATSLSATLGILPNSANAVGADMLGLVADEAHSIVSMMESPKKAVMLANVEPDFDTYHAKRALNTLLQAETVIALTPYAGETIKKYADVILPVATFTETPGSFVNMEGNLQSFYSTSSVLGNTKPMWKVIRVIANLLGLGGFEFENSQEVLAEAVSHSDITSLSNQINVEALPQSSKKPEGFIRVGGVSLYNTDAIVRRAPALQQTPQANAPALSINSHMCQKLGIGIKENIFAVQPGGDSLGLTVHLDDSLPDYVVYLPLHQSNQCLGALMGEIVLQRGE